MRPVGGKDLPRRTILIGAGAFTLLAMSGCGSLNPGSAQARRRIEKSLKSFEVHIMNRNGSLVYEYKGDIRKWEGWNGRKNGKGEPLAVGTYFYIIRAVGWDGVEFSGKEYKGVLQLYR